MPTGSVVPHKVSSNAPARNGPRKSSAVKLFEEVPADMPCTNFLVHTAIRLRCSSEINFWIWGSCVVISQPDDAAVEEILAKSLRVSRSGSHFLQAPDSVSYLGFSRGGPELVPKFLEAPYSVSNLGFS